MNFIIDWLPMDLNTFWFLLVGVLLTGYAILDGFDLGVGILHLFTKSDTNRRILLNSIGPVWDGNEVWLVVGGGALYGGFPVVFSSVFSGFYLIFILLITFLLFRAVALEFRSKQPMTWWRNFWDVTFSLSSALAAFFIGLVLGNIAQGIPLNEKGYYTGGFFDIFTPFPLMVGLTTIALFAMHGSLYVAIKTEGELQEQSKSWAIHASALFILGYFLITMWTLLFIPNLTDHVREQGLSLFVVLLSVLAIANIPRSLFYNQYRIAFLSSCISIFFLMILFGLGMYPDLVFSNPNPALSLDIYNAASSQNALSIMSTIALIGFPLVLFYTVTVYWIFRGKVKLDEHSY